MNDKQRKAMFAKQGSKAKLRTQPASTRYTLDDLQRINDARPPMNRAKDGGAHHKDTRAMKDLTVETAQTWAKRPGARDIVGVDAASDEKVEARSDPVEAPAKQIKEATGHAGAPTIADLKEDIPTKAAYDAFRNTSHVPDRRAETVRQDYANTLSRDYAELAKHADTPEKAAALDHEFEAYRARYRARYMDWLAAHGRTASAMITGPANFPTARNNKANAVERKRSDEMEEFRKRAVKAMKRKLTPELQPIRAGDSDATERLSAKIERAEADQARMKAVNAAHRRFLKDPATLESAKLSDGEKALIRGHESPSHNPKAAPFAGFQLTNNNANIRRMKQRRHEIASQQSTPATTATVNGTRVVDNPSANRVQVFFEGKPRAEVRTKLKSNGFRWTPSIGAWQAYRNPGAMEKATTIAEGEQ